VSKPVQPLNKTVEARPHRPVYRMHRYFARRPYSVFSELISHYTSPTDVVLDPFCGGGVTLVEGVLQGRRVIGYDLNPLAVFITKMELLDVDTREFAAARERILARFTAVNDKIFRTRCRKCKSGTTAHWFEYSAVAECCSCGVRFCIAAAYKRGVGTWACPKCETSNHFSVTATTSFEIVNVAYHCGHCGRSEVSVASETDNAWEHQIHERLVQEEQEGLRIPSEEIPDCNMQRESALHKKGIRRFRQLFTDRHLMAIALLRQEIFQENESIRDWLLLAFSSTLRYTNRMVTRNPAWRGDQPLEWATPGFWLPPVHLEANLLEQFERRCDAVIRGKSDYESKMPALFRPKQCTSAEGVLNEQGCAFHVSAQSATTLQIPNASIDAIITDPPYGSYVHYADLCNFWAIWFPKQNGLGAIIDDTEEAVIARKKFPGAKDARRYQELLELCFAECGRVLKRDGYMVLTFHNREPRAWAALLVAATKAGFELVPNGVLFQDGIKVYKHTAQSRRDGSVIGDFILSFKKRANGLRLSKRPNSHRETPENLFISAVNRILRRFGPLAPNDLMVRLYGEIQPYLVRRIHAAIGSEQDMTEELLRDFDSIQLFDSHRRQLLERHFEYDAGKWHVKT